MSHLTVKSCKQYYFIIILCYALLSVLTVYCPSPVQGQVPGPISQSEADKVKDRIKLLPSADEKITPVETEKIDQAGKQLGKKIDEIGKKASFKVGKWINADLLYGISWLKLSASIIILLAVAFIDGIIRRLIRSRVRYASQHYQNNTWRVVFLEALKGPFSLFAWVYGIYVAISPLLIHLEKSGETSAIRNVAANATDIGGTVAVIWFVYRLVGLVDIQLGKWARLTDVRTSDVLVNLVGLTLRTLIVTLGSIILIQNLTGIEIGPLLASLGLGGLAIALAAKDSIANFFGTLTIIFDRPFQTGERIILDKYDGIVESIGFRSTRIRTFDGHLVSIPNEKAVNTGVENVGRRHFIRWVTNLAISCETPSEKVERAVNIVRDILKDHEGMNPLHPPQVFFNAFNDWSLNIAVFAWYHPADDYWKYQKWVQKTSLEIMQRFQNEGIELAFPNQHIHFKNQTKSPD
jgi:MscS family membrane protein